MYDFYNFYFLYLLISYYPKAIYFCALLLYLALLLSFHCFFLRREHWLFRVFLVMSWISYHLQVDFTFLQIQVTPFSPSVCHEVMGPDTKILVFWMLSFKPAFSLSTFTFIKSLFSSSLFSAIRGIICISEVVHVSPGNLDCSLRFIQPTFGMMYSVCKLNKQGDNIQLWYIPFPILNQLKTICNFKCQKTIKAKTQRSQAHSWIWIQEN